MKKLLYVGALALGVLATGCGAGTDADTSEASPVSAGEETSPGMMSPSEMMTPMPIETGPAKLSVMPSGIGKIVVGTNQHTAYLFEKDKNGKSSCTGACAEAWPPVLSEGKPEAGEGVKANLLGTLKRADGKMQVTYNKHPLYYFAKDEKPGDTKGQKLKEFGAEWYAVNPDGKKVG
ncbi:hypothetical protein [Microtetraspora sp. NBRC 16547]|uniref:COG4315 family predicted lipoprotein n=1 Tax=Microtetraspora sp. NBRC 16547 TaxID=3030993 RepID=UPI0024A5E20E|nr:hypothetical protein [Microtetraspora sp. NBRC 16547]GLX00374.1 lipoprotein [Microtetraspora sp. NBRC 16547]